MTGIPDMHYADLNLSKFSNEITLFIIACNFNVTTDKLLLKIS